MIIIKYNIYYMIFSKETEELFKHYDINDELFKNAEVNKLFHFLNNVKSSYTSLNIEQMRLKSIHIPEYVQDNIPEISDEIKQMYEYTHISFKTSISDVNVSVFSKEVASTLTINSLIYIISFIANISNHNITNLNINIYLSDHKKIMNYPYLKKVNINSGYCKFISDTQSDIMIYRSEELLKVTIHELIHGFRYDYAGSRYDSNELIHKYIKNYKISVDQILSNEAYTEIWANIIHSYLLSKLFNKRKLIFIILLSYEKLFSMIQASKILKLIKDKNYEINRYTAVLSYFIIRAEIYTQLSRFLHLCKHSNQKYINVKYPNNIINFLSSLPKYKYHFTVTQSLQHTSRMSGFSIIT
tara:strand:+ start:3102 stop:4172 length:1071 start_codon:yes stop_codon:yes gene_type:complete